MRIETFVERMKFYAAQSVRAPHAEASERLSACALELQAYLAAHGSPLMHASAGRVLLCKGGTWADGHDIPTAMAALQAKLEERARQ